MLKDKVYLNEYLFNILFTGLLEIRLFFILSWTIFNCNSPSLTAH